MNSELIGQQSYFLFVIQSFNNIIFDYEIININIRLLELGRLLKYVKFKAIDNGVVK